MNFFFFSTDKTYENYHRRREVEAFADEIYESNGKAIYFNRPIFFLKRNHILNKKPCQNVHVKNLYVGCPLSIAFKSSWLMFLLVALPIKLQLWLIKKQLKLNPKEVIHWLYKPDQYLYLNSNTPHIYLHYDNYAGDKNYFFSSDKRFDNVLKRCVMDSVVSLFSSAKLIKESQGGQQNKTHYYPNAISRTLQKTAENEGVSNKADHKVIGFIGQLDDSFDVQLLVKLAAFFPNHQIVLIGPVKNDSVTKAVLKYANIELKGYVDYNLLAGYIKTFNVGICPYSNSPFNVYRNPLKISEYFSYGLPVVSSICDIDLSARPLLSIAETNEQFIEQVAWEIANDSQVKASARLLFAKENCWDNRAQKVIRLIKEYNA
jgi:hypothetical protein